MTYKKYKRSINLSKITSSELNGQSLKIKTKIDAIIRNNNNIYFNINSNNQIYFDTFKVWYFFYDILATENPKKTRTELLNILQNEVISKISDKKLTINFTILS